MNSIKVAYLIEQCWHRVPGGTAVAAVNLAEEMCRIEGIDLVGIAANHKKNPQKPIPENMKIVNSKFPRQILYEMWNKLNIPKAENLAKSVDLVHASGGAIPPTDLPLVATIHDLSWREEKDWSPPRGRRFAETWLDKARKAERIICPSKTTFNDLVKAGFDEQRIRVIPLGVRKKNVDNQQVEDLLEENSISTPFVLWVGTIEPRKNIPTLLQAMKQIPEIPLVLVGPKGWESDLQSLIAPIEDRVKIIGEVDEVTKHAWYKAASVFCFPSLMEGFGLPVAEAMSHGTPVVTSSTTATAEVAGDSTLLIDPKSAEDIADSITKILNKPEVAKELSEKGLERVKKMTWKDTALATVDIYREVAI
ncbi:MAG: glycosyltransferase family 1 protein [Acidimicrobiales bacterium]|nr:glycosyltransferase family 1 protein [Acidimicrobiales bacterium]